MGTIPADQLMVQLADDIHDVVSGLSCGRQLSDRRAELRDLLPRLRRNGRPAERQGQIRALHVLIVIGRQPAFVVFRPPPLDLEPEYGDGVLGQGDFDRHGVPSLAEF